MDLNTSHVKVKPFTTVFLGFLTAYLNTSHVKVKHDGIYANSVNQKFKYISC